MSSVVATSEMTVAKLRELAKEMKLQGYSKLKKDELIALINAPPAAAAVEKVEGKASEKVEKKSDEKKSSEKEAKEVDLSVPSLNWTLVQLKEQSKAFSLKVSGSKADLLARITEHLQTNPSAEVIKVVPKEPKSPKSPKSPKEEEKKESSSSASSDEEVKEETLTSSITKWFQGFKSVQNILGAKKYTQETLENAIATIQETLLHIKKKKELKQLIKEIEEIPEDAEDTEPEEENEDDQE
jgi:hypothetical protein